MPPGSSAMAKCRTTEFFLQPSRNDADDAGMPAFGGGHDDGALFLKPERGARLGLGLRQRPLLDRLALLIEPVELAGNFSGFDRIVFEQKLDAEIGAADAPAGIDARPKQKTEMPGFRRPGKPRHVHQADMAHPLAPPQRDQALGDEGAIEPDQWHHVGDGAERNVVEKREQVRLATLHSPKAALAQHPINRNDRHESQADGG